MSKTLVRQSVRALLCGAVVTAGLGLAATQADAAMTLDFRFADGTNSKAVTAGEVVTFDAWATLVNGDGNWANDKLSIVSFSALSSVVNAGITGTFSPAAANPQIEWGFSYYGKPKDANGDGVGDLGSNLNTGPKADIVFLQGPLSTIPAGGSVGSAVGGNKWEFKVATLTFTVGDAPNGAAVDLAPTFNKNVAQAYWYYEDGASKLSSAANFLAVAGTSVRLTAGDAPPVDEIAAKISDQGVEDAGTVAVLQVPNAGPGNYFPQVSDIPNTNKGTVKVEYPAGAVPSGPQMLILWAEQGDDAAALAELQRDATAQGYEVLTSGDEFNRLANWPELIVSAGRAPNFVLKFGSAPANPYYFSWDWSGAGADTNLDLIAAAPEPASLGLLALGGLALLRRRRA